MNELEKRWEEAEQRESHRLVTRKLDDEHAERARRRDAVKMLADRLDLVSGLPQPDELTKYPTGYYRAWVNGLEFQIGSGNKTVALIRQGPPNRFALNPRDQDKPRRLECAITKPADVKMHLEKYPKPWTPDPD